MQAYMAVKAYVGCRTMDLCALRSDQLRDGRLTFDAAQTKTRVARSVPLPPDLYTTLDKLKGPVWLWERFADDAVTFRKNPNKGKAVLPFTPKRLYDCVGNLFAEYNRARPGLPKLRAHDLRRAALTAAAIKFGVDRAARAMGVDPQTARAYYVDAARAFDGDSVYEGLADWWRYGGGGSATEPPTTGKSA